MRLILITKLMLLLTVLSGCQSKDNLPAIQQNTQSLTQQVVEQRKLMVQGIPSPLDQEVKADFKSRIITEFTPDQQPTSVLTTTVSVAPTVPTASSVVTTGYGDSYSDDYFYLPDATSIWLIRFGGEADDLANRYNALLVYTRGLLTAIEQSNNVTLKVQPLPK